MNAPFSLEQNIIRASVIFTFIFNKKNNIRF